MQIAAKQRAALRTYRLPLFPLSLHACTTNLLGAFAGA